ncbi:MAG: hypothetical protein M1828_001023 [Chrysothrix sp. TS-e1954]|nr:MAG: hypothetical protein M1828_001023 [Chrysothrix sp. TS-e1954]
MPLMQQGHEALPYIDADPSPDQRTEIEALIAASLPSDHATALHPSLADLPEPHFTPLTQAAHESIAQTGKPRAPDTGIDSARYEAPDAPADTSDVNGWREALRAAYTSQQYLNEREANLGLLEKYGRNAWLIGNSQTEDVLRALERELREARDEVDRVEEARRTGQEAIRPELEGLESTWRQGLGRAIEAEVAGEGLRRQILDRQRQSAVSGQVAAE